MRKTLVVVPAAVVIAVACGAEHGSIAGTVTGAAGVVAGAEVSAAGYAVTTDATGQYSISGLGTGSVEVAAIAAWYQPNRRTVEVRGGATATVDFELTEVPLAVATADAILADVYNADFDWTRDAVSITHVTTPTRAGLEMAIHYRNPALVRDPSGESQVIPPAPPILGDSSSFDFEVAPGRQALDVATVVDEAASTPYGGTPDDGVLLWGPALEYLLGEWSEADSLPLYAAGIAIREQRWEGSSILPTQEIERAHLHDGDIWVEVVFQEFLVLGAGITDANQDGYCEVWARVHRDHFSPSLYDQLRDVYIGQEHSTMELVEILADNLDDLYSRGTDATIASTIGIPYAHAHLGLVEYPFAVVVHAALAISNVLLVAP